MLKGKKFNAFALKDITPWVAEDTFSEVATRLSRSAEPSRQVC